MQVEVDIVSHFYIVAVSISSLGLETELLNIRLYATHIHGIHFFIHVAGDDRKKLTNILIGNLHII